jgi:hypothetical protein
LKLNINIDAVVKFTNILEKMHKSALPVAIRQTLNDAAFDVKKNTMPQTATSKFTQRQKNFFMANSRVEVATGFDLKTMRSTVGFYENRLVNQSTNYAVKDLEKQETGGTIHGKTFIPTVFARRGKSNTGLVKPNARLSKIRKSNIINAKDMRGQYHKLTKHQQFIVAAKRAGIGGFVIYNDLLLMINGIDGKTINAAPLYSVKKSRSVNVSRTSFMRSASEISGRKLPHFYVKNAQKQMEKYYGKL